MKKYGGAWPTMVTAFDNAGKLDLEGNARITKYLIEMGSDGLFVVCQSSEMFFLSLKEKADLAKTVVEAANGRVPVIASGHTSDKLENQIEEIREISKTGIDAVILVSNRLAKKNDGSEVFISNLQTIFDEIPNVDFGIYECPYPYRRLLTDEELKYCVDSGRIVFLKDVSCNIEIEKKRVRIAKGSSLHLFNANTETLLDSLIAGYDGYNGVMGNFHIDIYKWIFENYKNQPLEAKRLQKELTEVGTIENFHYPMNAKYHMRNKGVEIEIDSRVLDKEKFTAEFKEKVHKLIEWEDETRKGLY
ncbi:MAG: dihydrodipicolinate synthase family protein [Clostridiales bacterium]|nr:dihydrodipicolinate synthase family protein [Clostridiales bacterium]